MNQIIIAATNMAVLKHFGVEKDELPGNVRHMHRRLVRRAYRTFRKFRNAQRRFIRAVRDVAENKKRAAEHSLGFLPSQVYIADIPLTGTMEKSSAEVAAAMIVRACHALGDAWQGVTWNTICDVMEADIAASRKPFCDMIKNPFLRPDIYELAEREFCTFQDGVATLTKKAMLAMIPHVMSNTVACKPVKNQRRRRS